MTTTSTPSASSRPASAMTSPAVAANRLHPRRPPPALARRRQPGAHVRLRLRDVDPRHPLIPELVILILHQLRGNLPRPRIPHRGLLTLTREQGGPPGGPRSTGSTAANTDRRAQRQQEATLRSGSPRQAKLPGSRPTCARRHRQPRAHPPSPALPRGPDQPESPAAPQSGSDPRQPTTRSPAPNSPGSATAPARRLN